MRSVAFLFSLCFILSFGEFLRAQSYNSDTDALMSELQELYGQEDNYDIDFVMTIKYPGQDLIRQKGSYISQGNKYLISMPDQKIICDGEKQWVWDIPNNYVQIYGASEEAIFSPKGVFDLLYSDQYTYAMTYEGMRAGKPVKELEFKPNDDFTDLGKARLTLFGQTNAIEKLELFYKDASRITLKLSQISNAASFDAGLFSFKKEDHPDITVDDLRLE